MKTNLEIQIQLGKIKEDEVRERRKWIKSYFR